MQVKKLNSIKDIADKYEFYIIDIWGVLHNGDLEAFPFALETLKWLKLNHKVSVILSNSPRNQIDIVEDLKDKLINEDDYDFLHSSGQEVENLLSEKSQSFFENLGNKVYILGFSNLYLKAGHQRVDDLSKADYILATRVPNNELSYSIPLLNQAIEKNIPLICANPDTIAQTFEGPCACPGLIFDYYKSNGGNAIAVGKPYKQIYERLWSVMKNKFTDFDKSKTLIIGDGLYTDIKGANNQSVDSILITSGIHYNFFENKPLGNLISKDEFLKLTKQNEILPSYICERFS